MDAEDPLYCILPGSTENQKGMVHTTVVYIGLYCPHFFKNVFNYQRKHASKVIL
jgi:hypothetical protein